MNTLPEYSLWVELALILTIAATAIVAAAYLAERLIRSAVWRRTLWQASAAGLVFMLAVEMTGMGRGLGQLMIGCLTPVTASDRNLPETSQREPVRAGIVDSGPSHVTASRGDSSEEGVGVTPRSEPSASETLWFAETGDSLELDWDESIDALPLSDGADVDDQVVTGPRAEFAATHDISVLRDVESHRDYLSRAETTALTALTDVSDEATAAAAAPAPRADVTAAPAVSGPSFSEWPALVWGAGAVAVAAYVLAGHVLLLLFRRKCRAVRDADLLQRVAQLARRLGFARSVRVVQSPRLTTPVAFGVWRPTIALPPGFADDFEPNEQKAMLVHELAHLAGRDPAWQQVVNLLCVVMWWQPAVWCLRWRWKQVSETAADEASLAVPEGPQHLAACLVAMGRRLTDGPRLGWISMTGDGYRSNLGRRVMRLLKLEPRIWQAPRRVRAGLMKSLIVIVLIMTMVFCSAWARPRVAFAEGESTMTQLKVTWSRSLAAAALAVLVGSFSGDTAADQSRPGDDGLDGIALALFDGDDEEEREERGDRERDEEGEEREERGDRERDEEGDEEGEEEGDREGAIQELREELEELAHHARELKHELEELPDNADEEARELREELEKTHHEMEEVEGALREILHGDREHEERERDEEEEHPEEVIHHLQRELEELSHHARELKHELEELPDDADEEARELQEKLERVHHAMEKIEGELRERMHGEREREHEREGEHRRNLDEVWGDLVRQREKLMNHGRELTAKLEHARREGHEDAVHELERALAEVKEHFQAIEREMREVREEAEHRDRPRPEERRPDEGPRGEMERRMHHLRVAAENLAAAGMHDQAEHLMRQAEQMARELGHEGGPRPEHHPDRPQPDRERPRPDQPRPDQPRPDQPRGEDLQRAVIDLHNQMREMRGQMEEMRHVLKELVERERARERE